MSYSQPPQGQVPPPGYYQGPPPKKKHTVRNVILVVLGIFILIFAGCLALLSNLTNEVDKAITEEQANDKPADVTVGEPFTHDDYAVAGGWRVVKEKFMGSANIQGLKITNNADEARAAQLTFRFYKGNEVLAEVECTANRLEKGEKSGMQCFSLNEKFPKAYDAIRVSDMW